MLFLVGFGRVSGARIDFRILASCAVRATRRLTVEPPGGVEDAEPKARFALSEAQALRASDVVQAAAAYSGTAAGGTPSANIERSLTVDAIPQTNVIEVKAEGHDRARLVSGLDALIAAYTGSRKQADRNDQSEALEEARHAAALATQAIADKRREMDSFRQRHGITSIEREENPGAARLKGLHAALNDAATKEVNAEAKLRAVEGSIAQGKGFVRTADKNALSQLEMRALDLREKIKDLEHDYTPQYLVMDPKFKALKANLARVELQIDQEKSRSEKAALLEAQEEHESAQRAMKRIREQADALKQDSQAFSARYVEYRRMAPISS